MSDLEGSDVKVYLYLIRRTFGFNKATDAISLSQFTSGIRTRGGKVLDKGTGLKKDTVIAALKRLETIGMIQRHEGRGGQTTRWEILDVF
jgi:Bacteriophage replication protein O